MPTDPRPFLECAIRMGYLDPSMADGLERALAGDVEFLVQFLRLLDTVQVDAIHASLAESGTIVDRAPRRETSRPTRSPGHDRYEVLETIGSGAMGVVRRARDLHLGREVAVKSLRGTPPPSFVDRFVEEARVTGQLEHPNIVPVHDLGTEEGGLPFLAMKRIKGRSLREVLVEIRSAPDGEVGLPRLLDVFLKVCDGVAYAHSQGVVHRDLKPANVMIGEFGEVLVMDWGLAKVVGEPDQTVVESSLRQATRAGTTVGTPAYMPPEQARGDVDAIDERSDVYSLGALLYEMLSLVPPVAGAGIEEILNNVRLGRIEPPSSRSRAPWPVPRDLEAVVLKATDRRQARRYRTVLEMRAEVEAYLEGRTLEAAEYSMTELAAKWIGRNRAAFLGAAATALALLLGLVAVGVTAGREARLRRSEAETTFAAGEERWAAAAATPFNPADPEEYYEVHLAALLEMGRGLQAHPEPPEAWRAALAERALALQDRAESVGDWAMARVLAGAVESWGAVDEAERERRVARVDRERRTRIERERQRLFDDVRRLSDDADRQGFVPGLTDELARRHAARSTRDTVGLVIELLSGPDAVDDLLARRLLIDVLGRCGDAVSDHRGLTAPDLIADVLEGRRPIPFRDEITSWIHAAGRLEARSPGAFVDRRGFEALLAAARALMPWVGHLEADAAVARTIVESAEGRWRPDLEALGWVNGRLSLIEIAEAAAIRVTTGATYTGHLLELLDSVDSLDDLAAVFVIDQLGLQASVRAGPVIAVLERIVAGLPDEWTPDARPRGVDEREWSRTRRLALAAAAALERLGAPGRTRPLFALMARAGLTSILTRELEPIFGASRMDDWTEPSTVEGFILRGRALALRGRLPAARADYDRALDLDPDRAEAHARRGMTFVATEPARCLAALDRAVELAPGEAWILRLRGRTRLSLGDPVAALDDLDAAVALDPDDWHIRYDRSDALGVLGRRKESLAELTRARDLSPSSPRIYLAYALAAIAEGRIEQGKRALLDALRLDPIDDEILVNTGIAAARMGRPEEAIMTFSTAIHISPIRADAYFCRGSARQKVGDVTGALEDYDRSIELDPTRCLPFLGRGGLRERFGDDAGALDDYRKALTIDPTSWPTAFRLGLLTARLGKTDEAAAAFDQALAHAPPGAREDILQARESALGH